MTATLDVDADLVRKLSALLDETGLSEIEFADGERRIRVSRAGSPPVAAMPAATEPRRAEVDGAAQDAGSPGIVTAPMVGTVYVAPEPGAEPFVRVGDAVDEGQTLLLIEAMKTYNPIRAPVAGRVTRILVADAMPVEFGEELIVLA